MFPRACYNWLVFPRLLQLACFPALGTRGMSSRAWHTWHVSRAWHTWQVLLPRLAQVASFLVPGIGSLDIRVVVIGQIPFKKVLIERRSFARRSVKSVIYTYY